MESLWRRLEAWLAEHWPQGLHSLNPPATDAQIAALESALGVALPAAYVACLKIHNGQDLNTAVGLFGGIDFLSTDEVLQAWTLWKELLDGGEFDGMASAPASGIRNDWWNPRWIPFTHNGAGDHLCIDLDPAPGGQPGQIVTMWHDWDGREVRAPDFGAWFKAFAKDVFAGEFVLDAEYGFVPRTDAAAS